MVNTMKKLAILMIKNVDIFALRVHFNDLSVKILHGGKAFNYK